MSEGGNLQGNSFLAKDDLQPSQILYYIFVGIIRWSTNLKAPSFNLSPYPFDRKLQCQKPFGSDVAGLGGGLVSEGSGLIA